METSSFVRSSTHPRLASSGLGLPLAAFRGAAAYEFRMQIRRRSVWLVLGVLGVYLLQLLVGERIVLGRSTADETATWAWTVQILMPIAVGVMLADRIVRDARLKVGEILDTSAGPFAARYLGKFAGATAATLVPVLLVYLLGLGWLVSRGLDPGTVASTAVAAFVLMNLPGLLFIAAFSVATPLIMPVPVYQFLYVGYWFWGNLVPPTNMPTLSETWLAPVGSMAGRAWFGVFVGRSGPATAFDAVMSISLLLAGAGAALLAGLVVVRFRRSRT